MKQIFNIGIIGCGDFLRLEADHLLKTTQARVVSLYDPAREKAEHYANLFDGRIAPSAEAIIDDPTIDMICLFVPPWLRSELFVRAAAAGKHILTTKPLANSIEAAEEILLAARQGTARYAVIYNRTHDPVIETMRRIFESGQIGKLALYRQDWLHHYPQWNKWALDRSKNGGPFIDAMIHNLNAARYLMGRKVVKATFFSDQLAHPGVLDADTETLKVDFQDGGTALLFITWAADMGLYASDMNDREHINVFYMITDEGWRVVTEQHDGRLVIAAHRGMETRRWLPVAILRTPQDRLIDTIKQGGELPSDMASISMAADDIRLLRLSEEQLSVPIDVNMSIACY
jgi:predicted dehydrogenase